MSEELELPPNCLECGIYKKTNTYNCQPTKAIKSRGEWVDVYVVTGKLYEHELSGFLSDEPGRWVRAMLDTVGVSYVLDGATRCSANKPTAKQKNLCSSFLLENIKKAQPRCILCLGLDAAQAVLNTKLSLSALNKAGIMEGPNGLPTIVVDHPSLHSSFRHDQWNGNDLREDYKRAFAQINTVLSNGWAPPVLEYTVYDEINSALEECERIALATHVGAWDTEFGIQYKYNITHHTTCLLTTGLGWWNEKLEKYEVRVFDMVDWSKEDQFKLMSALCRNQILVSTFIKIDFQISYFCADYDVWNGDDRVHSFFDTGQIRWLQDQERRGNGLEEQCVQYLGAEPWKYKVDDKLKELEATKPFPLEEGLENYDMRHLPRDFRNEYQAWDLFNQARLWWEHYASKVNACELKEKFNIPPWKRTQAFTEYLCYCERTGLVLDVDYLALYKECMEKKSEYVMAWLQEHPYISTLQHTINPEKPAGPILDKDGLPELYKSGPKKGQIKQHPMSYLIPEEFNPGSTHHMSAIVEYLGIKTRKVTDKTRRPKVDAAELIRQAGGDDGKDENGNITRRERSKQEQFFYAVLCWRRFEKQVSSFIEPFLQYAVPTRVNSPGYQPGQFRAHPMFKMSKVDSQSGTDSLLEGGVDSGRISSTNPCGTNIDKKPVFRRAFPAPPGCLFWEADQASVEPRVLAYNSNCRSWIEIFKLRDREPDNPDADLYLVEWRNFLRAQGKKWVQAGDVTKAERQQCKPLVLGAMYEATPYGVHMRDNVPLDVAKAFMEQFWNNVPEIQAYNAEARRKCFEGEMIIGTSGRRHFFQFKRNYAYDHDKMKHLSLMQLQEVLDMPEEDAHIARKLENTLTQGTAKDITDVTGIEMVRYIKQHKIPWLTFNNTVHDSLWGYCWEDNLRDLYWLVQKIAPDASLLEKWGIFFNTKEKILLASEVKAGPHLGALKGVKFEKSRTLMKVPGLNV